MTNEQKLEECRDYWDRLPWYKKEKYFTEMDKSTYGKTFYNLTQEQRELAILHISRVLKI